MELHQIRYFLEAAETLNFTRASENCNVSQPALTRAIKKLEDELGGVLFRRERNKTHLTELGKVMEQYLSRVDASTKEATIAAQQVISLEKATLRIGIICTLDPAYLIDFLFRFRNNHPGIEIAILHYTTETLEAALLSGDVDCAFLGIPLDLKDRFDTFDLFEENMVLAFPRNHRFHNLEKIMFKDLNGESYLDRLNCELRTPFNKLLDEHNISVNTFYKSDREDWIQNMIASGMGITMLPQNTMLRENIESREISDLKLSRTIQLVTVSGHIMSAALKAFTQELKKHKWSSN